MSTLPVHIQACEPSLVDFCGRCGGSRYEFPLMGMLVSGLVPIGAITLCPDCDTPGYVVREHLIRGGD